ncbi:MAG TPA: SET domain-containing protein [Anaeromyxobacteraceae bacterium]|nr:SET domain-containing protein [Anaeromyxobacteraceae bacterium]
MKTYLAPSRIHGTGLFAGEDIPRGTVVWRRDPTLDIELTEEQIEALAPPSREQVVKYTYLDIVRRTFVLCGDDARFFNHEEAPNCLDYPDADGGTTVAARDIRAGEELTSDYGKFDANHRGM